MILADFNPAILFLLLWGLLSWFTKKKKREARENITEDSGVKIEKEDIFTRLQKLQDHLAGEVEIFPKKPEEEEIEWEQEDIEEEPVLVQEPVVEYPIPDEKEWYGPYFDYEKALLAFHQNQYSSALDLLNSAINSYTAELDIILGNAYLLQGMINDKMDNRIEAKSNYKKCLELDNFSSAMEKAKQYFNQPYQGK